MIPTCDSCGGELDTPEEIEQGVHHRCSEPDEDEGSGR